MVCEFCLKTDVDMIMFLFWRRKKGVRDWITKLGCRTSRYIVFQRMLGSMLIYDNADHLNI